MPDIYLYLDGQQKGPYQPAQLRQFLNQGLISSDTAAWHQGMSEWGTVSAVLAEFTSAGVPPPPPASIPPPAPVPVRTAAPEKKKMHGCLLAAIIVVVCFGGFAVLSCLAGIALGPITNGIKKAKENVAMQQARQIESAMEHYAVAHNGTYPDGKTSTEVFQKLIDEKYVTDPGLFYISSMSDKSKATSNKLTAANVCFDVTSGVSSSSPAELPVVFSTGYNLTYSAGTTPEADSSGTQSPFPGLAVAYKNGSARFINFRQDETMDTVDQVVPAGFDAQGKTYQQIKP